MGDQWTDERLDDFRGEVSRRFDDVDRRFEEVDRRFDKVEGEMVRLHDRMDSMQRTTILMNSGIIAALLGVIGTQL